MLKNLFDIAKQGAGLLAMTNPQLQALKFGAGIVGGALQAKSAYDIAGKQLPLINQSMQNLLGQKEQVSDIAAAEKKLAFDVRKEDRAFSAETTGFKKEQATNKFTNIINQQGFATSLRPEEVLETSMDVLDLASDRAMTTIDRQYGTKLMKIDESEASKMAAIDQSLQNLQIQKEKLAVARTGAGMLGSILG